MDTLYKYLNCFPILLKGYMRKYDIIKMKKKEQEMKALVGFEPAHNGKLEDLKVLRRSPDLLNNVKIGHGQLQFIMEQILFYHIWGLQPFWSSRSNRPVISEKKMFR